MRKKWGSPKQLAAFRKMQRARRASIKARKVASGVARRKPAAKKKPLKRRRNPMSALIANPGYTSAYARGYETTFGTKTKPKRRRKTKGTKSMARKRKRRTTTRTRKRRAAPRRRRTSTRRAAPRRRKRAVYRVRPSKRTRTIYVNPRRRRRRRNPSGGRGIKGIAKRFFVPYATGFVASMAAAVMDSALSQYPKVKHVAKVGGAVLLAAVAGKKYPIATASAIATLAASSGYALGTKLAGGMLAFTPGEAVKGVAEMSEKSPELGALLEGGLGALLEGPPDLDSTVSNYETALNNMADDDDDY